MTDSEEILGIDNNQNEKKRGGCLTAFIVVMLVANIGMSLYYVVTTSGFSETSLIVPAWTIPTLVFIGLLNIGFAIAIWNWNKIGVYGFWVNAVAAAAINISLGLTIFQAVFGFLGPIILTLLVRPKWDEFR